MWHIEHVTVANKFDVRSHLVLKRISQTTVTINNNKNRKAFNPKMKMKDIYIYIVWKRRLIAENL